MASERVRARCVVWIVFAVQLATCADSVSPCGNCDADITHFYVELCFTEHKNMVIKSTHTYARYVNIERSKWSAHNSSTAVIIMLPRRNQL